MNGKRYDERIKARALAALLTGERPGRIARDLGVPEGTVRSWRHRLKNGQIATLKKGAGGSFGRLLMDQLEGSLASLIAQSEQMADPEWILRQRAGEMAVLFGVLFDRTWRMLELLPAVSGVDVTKKVTPKKGPEGGR